MLRIALVEDEADLRELIQEELEDAGFEVHPAADGKQGYDLILHLKPDLILSDINMPGMNGFQMRRALQEAGMEHAETPFIFISAFADQTDIAEGLVVGADHYVTKPIDFDALIAWARKLTSAA
ncbi:MAG: response regulator [Pseudomonadota bacterium]